MPSARARSSTSARGRSSRRACRWRSGTAGAGESLKLDVNVSAREFAEPAFPTQVQRIISLVRDSRQGRCGSKSPRRRSRANRAASGCVLRQLHEIGVRLVVDDFGTGASSLVSLKQFPFDAIKIDRAFVADLGARP